MDTGAKLGNFIQCLLDVAKKAANVARLIRSEPSLLQLLIQKKTGLSKNERFVDDFKTLADVIIQEMIKHDVTKKFNDIKGSIYGEESNVFTNKLGETVHVEVKDTQQETCLLLQRVLNDNRHASQILAAAIHQDSPSTSTDDLENLTEFIDVSSVAIWIDPIDATAQYIEGDWGSSTQRGFITHGLQTVLVLIGVYDRITGLPLVGCIDQPFSAKGSDQSFSSLQLWGAKLDNFAGISDTLANYPTFSASLCKDRREKPVILISDVDTDRLACLSSHFDVISTSGAGYKLMATACGVCCGYVLTGASSFKWDTCSPHAILRACGGGIICLRTSLAEYRKTGDIRDDELQIGYEPSKNGVMANEGGILAYRDPEIMSLIVRLLVTNEK